jgi:small GTP-binding protein
VDFKIKRTKIDGRDVCLNIWDTAGQERFRNITKSFYKNAQGIVLTYSIDNYTSFQHIENWIEQIRDNGVKEVEIILVGNKADLEHDRKVSKQMGEQLANRFKI